MLPVLPSLMVALACAVLWLGELTFPRPSGAVRTTVLNARAIGQCRPACVAPACVVLGALDLVLFAGALTADDGPVPSAEGNVVAWPVPTPGSTT